MIALLVALAIAAHKHARIALLAFGAHGQRVSFWEKCDLLNAQHYSKNNQPLVRVRSPFGGMMTSIFIVAFCMAASMLILNNVLYPSYDLSGTLASAWEGNYTTVLSQFLNSIFE